MLSRKMESVLKKEGWIISWNTKVSYLWNYEFGSNDLILISSSANDLDLIRKVVLFNENKEDEKINSICNKLIKYFIKNYE